MQGAWFFFLEIRSLQIWGQQKWGFNLTIVFLVLKKSNLWLYKVPQAGMSTTPRGHSSADECLLKSRLVHPTNFSTCPSWRTPYTSFVWNWACISPSQICPHSFMSSLLGNTKLPVAKNFRAIPNSSLSLTRHTQTLSLLCWLCLHITSRPWSFLSTLTARSLV